MRLRRQPTPFERLIGMRRARRVRRQVALVAFGLGLVALRPTLPRLRTVVSGLAFVTAVGFVVLR